MIKEYKDERINELIKKSFERAVKDDEWQIRYLQEWNILFEDIDKMLNYINNGCVGELRVNSNMWWVLQETLAEVLDLYGLELIGEKRVSENELVIPKKDNQIKKRIFNKMIKYGWNLGYNDYADFYNVYAIHKDFLDNAYDLVHEFVDYNEKFDMNKIDFQSFSDMLDFMTDFLRALNEVDKEVSMKLDKKIKF